MQTRLVDLVLNLLRKDQYAAADENPDELYLVTDDAGITGADVVNALGYVPYNGTTNPDHYITSSSIPTVGNGTIRIKQDNKTQQFTVNQTATQLISLNGLYDYYTINATVHSNPTISGSGVSNFTNGWLSTQYQFPNNWEISTTFFLDNPPSETADEEEQMIIYSSNLAVRLDGIDDDEDAMSVYINGTWYNLGAYPYSGENYQVTISSYNQADGVHTVGTYVYVYSPSADEELYNAKLTSNVVAPTNTPVEIQFGAYNGTEPLYATMYFDETYINVLEGGTTRYWTGAEKTIDTKVNTWDLDSYVKSVNNELPDANGNVTIQTGSTPNDGVLTITQDSSILGTFTANQAGSTNVNVKGLYNYYTLNAYTVGTPTVEDCIVSGFSNSNYIEMRNSISISTGFWEFQTKFTTGATVPTSAGEFQFLTKSINSSAAYGIDVYLDGANPEHINLTIGNTGVAFDVNIAPNTTYIVKAINGFTDTYAYDGKTHVYVYDETGTLINSWNGTVSVYPKNLYMQFGTDGSNNFGGSIDFENTFINSIALDTSTLTGTATRAWTGAQPTIDTKADTDLNNITDSAKVMMSGMGMPSNTYTDLTLGASGSTYTAPADGYFVILMNAVNNTNMTVGIAAGVSRVGFTTVIPANNNLQGNNFGGFIPVKKGDTASVFYNGTTSAFRFRFVYAVGSESEAN